MNQQEAIEVLVNAVRIATKRGAFELEETEIISQAVRAFTTTQEQPQEVVEENVPND